VTYSAIARDFLALLCSSQGLGALAMDINRSHATNPRWPGHARFHLVWQAISFAILSILEVAALFIPGPLEKERCYLVAILASIPMLAFFGALICGRLYDGTLSNPIGILPVRIAALGFKLHIDLSLVVEIVAILLLVVIVELFGY
jgi:hypothetical protein